MDVAERTVAIVGPNEAGKTSFLRAFLQLNEEGAFSPSEFTRGGKGKACVIALHSLDDEDRKALGGLPGVTRATKFEVWKRENGRINAGMRPELTRDRGPRQKAQTAMERVIASKWFRELVDADLQAQFAATRVVVSSEKQTLSDDERQELETLAAQIVRAGDAPASALKIATQLSALSELEGHDHPETLAVAALLPRRPRFLFFEQHDRDLKSVYDINVDPPRALDNLLAVARLSLPAVRTAVAEGDSETLEELQVAANEHLSKACERAWTQARVLVRLRVDGAALHVFASSKPGRFIKISERSEGLRQFVALLTYVERYKTGVAPILLIDEADTHLHYDAQADLMRVFADQREAAKIIYTTHSAGCLPQDLGAGVRMIVPVGPADAPRSEWERSAVRNWFWTDTEPGEPAFSSLLIGMGASAFAFSAMRAAVVGEGITEAMLLPSLFREVIGGDEVGFQVTPGLAEAGADTIHRLDLTAARVAYLVDGDAGGTRKRKQLTKAKVPQARVKTLGAVDGGLTLEDLLTKTVYLNAVNTELRNRHGVEIPASKIPERGRAKAVEHWCARHKGSQGEPVGKPSKRAVAYHVLDQRLDQRLHATAHRQLLKDLHIELADLLNRPSHE